MTSKTNRRWIIPKGKIGAKMLASRSAEREAFEEAGVLGRIAKEPVGVYRQTDQTSQDPQDRVTVQAFALEVADELPVWHEMADRERCWFTVSDALEAVGDPEIRAILRLFDESLGARSDNP